MNGATVSAIGVAMAQQKLIAAGFGVAVPLVQEPWDLLVYRRRRVWRVEVKSTSSKRSVDCRRGHDKRLRYSPQHVDAVVGVHVVTGQMVWVPTRWIHSLTNLYFSQFTEFDSPDMLFKAKRPKAR